MERSLDFDHLEDALGGHERLPSAEEFADRIETLELAILEGGQEVEDTIGSTAWLLHGIASSHYAKEEYGPGRQRAAFRVSAHAFDLLLKKNEHDPIDRIQLCFAAQVAYLRSDLDPNAIAVFNREVRPAGVPELDILKKPAHYALSCAAALVAFDTDYLFEATDGIYERLEAAANTVGVDSIDESPFGTAGNLVAGCRDLLVFFVYGREPRLEAAESRLQRAVHPTGDAGERLSRWAAAHLLNMLPGLYKASIWNCLPPDVPDEVRRAFTLAPPQILTLWPPQLEMISSGEQEDTADPFAPENTRQLITMPTSGGKTLFSHLIIASQLHRSERGVCYVAPTRSLTREVRKDLNRRMRFVSQTGANRSGEWMDSDATLKGEADIEVMTPERLSYLLREDAQSVLDRFGLFIFDEVHSVGDDKRGWTLEQDLSYLHHATKEKEHQIILMSAAVGNRGHFVDWMEGENQTSHYASDWRATRRIHSIYETKPRWGEAETSERRSKKYPIRQTVPLDGILHVRGLKGHDSIQSDNPVGELVYKESTSGTTEKESNHSTSNYETVVPLINHLANLGPVLVIQSIKRDARLTAEAIAEAQPVPPTSSSGLKDLIELIQSRLGNDHPLVYTLERGVAYHHGSLPNEVRQGIEDAVSNGELQRVVATTTMTQGINLPVRSVVIISQGIYRDNTYEEHIVGSRLLNAVGRAGRAAKETEGVVVLAQFDKDGVAEDDFARLSPDQEELQVNSWLSSKQALDHLAQFEQLARDAEDAVIQASTDTVSSFLSYVWFLAAELERLDLPRTPDEVVEWLRSTLAWVQLNDVEQKRWLRVAAQVLERYERTDARMRQRWARSGTSPGTAIRLEDLAEEVAEQVAERDEIPSDKELVLFLLDNGRLDRILEVSDAPTIDVDSRRGRGKEKIDLDLVALTRDWLEGVELETIASEYLGGVEKTDYRFQQLGDLVYDLFEIHLPWMLRVIVDWTNERLAERPGQSQLSEDLPSLVRWGVPNSKSAELMNRGIGSRQLAIEIGREWSNSDTEEDIGDWVRRLPRSEWTERFDANVSELRSLVSMLRPQSNDTLLPFLRGEAITVPVQKIEETDFEEGEVEVSYPSKQWESVEFEQEGQKAGFVKGSHTEDVKAILQMGVRFAAEVVVENGEPALRFSLIEPD
jgi:hypothetical protein